MDKEVVKQADIVLVGAGIMSATLGTFLKELEPDLNIVMFERLQDCAQESTHSWNNAGTGHAAFCELNYTPQNSDGTINIEKALKVNMQFNNSLQFWSYLTKKGEIQPKDFILKCPHMSFVRGEDNIKFLSQRQKQMSQHHFFETMQYTQDINQIEKWAPLIVEGRDKNQKIAATFVEDGTDVDFGTLTHNLINNLKKSSNFSVHYKNEVTNLKKLEDGRWEVEFKNLVTNEKNIVLTKFIFAGAGGEALTLLQKSKIPQGKGYGGFPVSGIWLRCNSKEIAARHHVKVYGKAEAGSPPMSVPHLDARRVNGSQSLLFGPYAGFSTKFLKYGSYLDLFTSIKSDNIRPMLKAGKDNWDLTKYLIKEVLKTKSKQFNSLKDFFPNANEENWVKAIAGQRVQIIKPDEKKGGVLEFGTRIISSDDKTFVGLLGASPGASIAAYISLDILKICFNNKLENDDWNKRLKEIIPTYEIDIQRDKTAHQNAYQDALKTLNI